MNPFRKTAIIVGVIYMIGTLTGVLSQVILPPIVDDPDFLVKIAKNQNQVITGTLMLLLSSLGWG